MKEHEKYFIYKLDYTEFKGEINALGDVMDCLATELYSKTGLRLGLINEAIFANFIKTLNSEEMVVIGEEFIPMDLSEGSIKKKILEHVNAVNGFNKNVTIVDPYFLKDESDEYSDMVIDILNGINPKSLKLVVNNQKSKSTNLRKKIVEEFNNVEIWHTSKFHDRYWIFDDKTGFIVGTSLNGIGKRYCLIQRLEDKDVEAICSALFEDVFSRRYNNES